MSGVSLNHRIIPPSDPRHWHQITSLLTRSIIQQCAGHWTRRTGRDLPRHSRKLVSLYISRKHKNCCLDIINKLLILDVCFDHMLSPGPKCQYCPGWAATLRPEEITKRWLGARFRDYSGPGTALWTLRRCELCDNHLSTESTVQPGQLPGTARTGYSYLGLYPGTQHQPQPHNPTWNSKSSQEKVLYRILFCYLQFQFMEGFY